MAVKNIEALDALLQKQAGFFDFLRPPEVPTFLRPAPQLGMARKKPELRETQKKERELWNKWNQGGRKPEDLQPLHQSFKPAIRKQVSVYAGKVPIPNSAIQHEFNKLFVNAVKTYDPNRGAALGSWVTTNLRKGSRYIKTYQNLGKIPEGQIKLITTYDQTKEDLAAKLGHEPDTKSIADAMGVPQRQVTQLERERRKDLATSGFASDPTEVLAPKELEALKLIQYDLDPEERTVYEYTFGMNGRPTLKPGEIAKQTKIHPSKISRIRKKLQNKVLEAMEVL